MEKLDKFEELTKEQNGINISRGDGAGGVRYKTISPLFGEPEIVNSAIARVFNEDLTGKVGAKELTGRGDRNLPRRQFSLTSKSKEYKTGSAELKGIIDLAESVSKRGVPMRVEDIPDEILTAKELKEYGYDPQEFTPTKEGDYGFTSLEPTYLITTGGYFEKADPNVPDSRGQIVLNSRAASKDAATEEALIGLKFIKQYNLWHYINK